MAQGADQPSRTEEMIRRLLEHVYQTALELGLHVIPGTYGYDCKTLPLLSKCGAFKLVLVLDQG